MSDKPKPDVDEIRQDIERTRRELSDTVEVLAYKANVPARTKEKAAAAKDTVKAKAEHAMHVAQDKAADVHQQAQQKIDNLPEPTAQRVRGIIAAIRNRPGVFIAGAVLSVVLVRRIAGRRRQG